MELRNNYKKLGDYIREIDVRNKGIRVTRLLGVSNEKYFIPSIANIVGTDLSNYKIVKRNQFAFGTVTSRNGDKLSIAILKEDECIVSSSYVVFEVIDESKLNPDYLMMWLRREEFDRYARFMSHGSVRELFGWDKLCDVELPIPDIGEQLKYVNDYESIQNAIKIKEAINNNLLELMNISFTQLLNKNQNREKQLFRNMLVLLKDGTHNPPKRVEKGIPLLSGESINNGFINKTLLTNIEEADYKIIHKNYKPEVNDFVLTKIGTVGKFALLREKDVPLCIHCNSALLRFKDNYKPSFIFSFLQSNFFQNLLKSKKGSSVQDFLSLSKLGKIELPIFSDEEICLFDKKHKTILEEIINNIDEIDKLFKLSILIISNISKL